MFYDNVIIIYSNPFYLSQVQQLPLEQFAVAVYFNGDVSCTFSFAQINLPSNFAHLPPSSYVRFSYIIGDDLKCEMGFDLSYIGEAEADVYSNNIKNSLEDLFNVKLNLVNRDVTRFTSTITGQVFANIKYVYTSSDFNPDVLVDKFLSLKPSEGFFVLVNRKIVGLGDKFDFVLTSGSNYAKLIFVKVFKEYFKLKIGETYTLDVFKLFNFTDSIKIHSLSYYDTMVTIILLNYGSETYCNLQAEIIDIEVPFSYRIFRAKQSGLPIRYEIRNEESYYDPNLGFQQRYSLTAGDSVSYIRVKFKIVEYGYALFKIDLNPTTIIGISILTICIIIPAIILKIKRGR
ncbi:MAG: hypothetical protein QXV26_02590 [Candidatus Methanomethylicia archaeon]